MGISSLLRKDYISLNRIEISKAALLHNYHYLSSLSGESSIAPVLKSNAYGHGLPTVAKVLDTAGAPYFCVDSLYEAYELQKSNVRTPILIMGYTNPRNLMVKKLPFTFTVYDKETIAVLNKYQPGARVHIFVDTGMHREGITMDDLSAFLNTVRNFNNIKIEGLMSHFAASDQYTNPLTNEQIKNFHIAQKQFQEAGIKPKWIHIGNSSATLHSKYYKNNIGTLMRTGLSIYGIDPEGKDTKLSPALSVMTTLGQIKKVHKGEKVGYDFTFTARKDMTIGILPYGYYDGLDRRLSNKGVVSINGTLCPIIGRISMNITTIDVSKVANPRVGQDVVIYSNNSEEKNSINNAANLAGTISYDLLVHLAESTKRVLV